MGSPHVLVGGHHVRLPIGNDAVHDRWSWCGMLSRSQRWMVALNCSMVLQFTVRVCSGANMKAYMASSSALSEG